MVWEERDPVAFLRTRIERFQPVRLPGLPPLVAGAIGYFSYDMVRLIERLPKRLGDDIGLFDAMLMFYHGIIAFDHVRHRFWIVRNVFTEGSGSLRAKYDAAVREIRETREVAGTPVAAEKPRREPRDGNVRRSRSLPIFAAANIWPRSASARNTFARAIFFRWSSASAFPQEQKRNPSTSIANFAP